MSILAIIIACVPIDSTAIAEVEVDHGLWQESNLQSREDEPTVIAQLSQGRSLRRRAVTAEGLSDSLRHKDPSEYALPLGS